MHVFTVVLLSTGVKIGPQTYWLIRGRKLQDHCSLFNPLHIAMVWVNSGNINTNIVVQNRAIQSKYVHC